MFFGAKAFFIYWLKKEDRFSQHSPYVFKIYSDLIHFLEKNKKGSLEIEEFRKILLQDRSEIEVLDLGAGSKKTPTPFRQVAEITRYSSSGIKFAQIYQFFCSLTPAQQVIELGTCVGISSRYLSKQTLGRLYTFEGSLNIQNIAKREPVPEQTEFILGPIHETLPLLLDKIESVDFALIDANHTYEGTTFTFYSLEKKAHPQTIIVIGDIHWTTEMERAWEEIKSNPKVRLTLDFFECGVIFFDYSGEKTDLILHI